MRIRYFLFITLLSFSLLTPELPGGNVTVDQSLDPIDIDAWTATIDDLPGPDGKISFSEAVIATNNTPGLDTIGFAVPQDEWIWQWAYPGCAVIVSGYTYYWRASDSLVIDGTTQTEFTGDTNPDGAEVVIYQDEFYFNAGGSALYGLHDVGATFSGSSNVIMDNTGGSDITLYDGSGNLIQNNVCGTIKIDRSDNNIVIGNTTTRVRVLGFGSGQPALNNRIGGPASADRNFITGYGTWTGEGMPSGTTVEISSATGTIIENNWIGTTADGLSQGSLASTQGFWLFNENNNTLIKDNRIAGILGHGQGPHHAGELYGRAILVSGSGAGVTIVGNTIGLDANGEPLLGSVTGIDVGNDAGSTVSGIVIEENVIAGNLFNGITIGHNVPQVRLSGNSLYENEQLGIDLIPSGYGFGVTLNDPLDADDGGNGLQNFPVIDEATSDGSSLTVSGSLHSSPGSEFTLEFFASAEGHPSGYGEGEQFLGETTVNTDGSGDAHFNLVLPASLEPGCMISATATLEPIGATSEFSAGVLCNDVSGGSIVECSIILGSASGDGSFQYTLTITNTSDTTQNRDIWMEVTGPDQYADLAFQKNKNIREFSTKNKTRNYSINGNVNGDYTVTLYTGEYPAVIDDWDSRVYTRTGSATIALVPGINSTAIPEETFLDLNYPNPFNPTTTIPYALSSESIVSLTIYNSLGQEIRELARGRQPAGYYSVTWDGTNDAGTPVSSGVYIYLLRTGLEVQSQKMMLSR
ncbi:MAG: T9SS type A sorting domain-containing protein [Ignavibacteria bacterium]|nr:T9SS type A sorting domain-containing protein [Ignavibacteria bacterium]